MNSIHRLFKIENCLVLVIVKILNWICRNNTTFGRDHTPHVTNYLCILHMLCEIWLCSRIILRILARSYICPSKLLRTCLCTLSSIIGTWLLLIWSTSIFITPCSWIYLILILLLLIRLAATSNFTIWLFHNTRIVSIILVGLFL